MAFLDISHLEKSFGTNRVVKDFSLGIDKGEFISLLGPSGCGKTTVLRMVAGFEDPSLGAIRIGGVDMVGKRPNQRNIGMVFQSYALFPNLTVAENVGFGLKIKGVARAEREARVAEMLALIGLPDLGGRYPFQLSGGQQQRVALARALAPKPQVLLLDEPLSALDAKVRVSLRNEIRAIQRELGITTIFVTHDQEEAMSISDRIVVMNGGVADQVGAAFAAGIDRTVEIALDLDIPTRFGVAQDRQSLQNLPPRLRAYAVVRAALCRKLMTVKRLERRFFCARHSPLRHD